MILNICSYICWPFVCLLWENTYSVLCMLFNWVICILDFFFLGVERNGGSCFYYSVASILYVLNSNSFFGLCFAKLATCFGNYVLFFFNCFLHFAVIFQFDRVLFHFCLCCLVSHSKISLRPM